GRLSVVHPLPADAEVRRKLQVVRALLEADELGAEERSPRIRELERPDAFRRRRRRATVDVEEGDVRIGKAHAAREARLQEPLEGRAARVALGLARVVRIDLE